MSALVCGGHVLFEDVPGTAKTVLARAIAGSIEGAVPSRIQCTPDLQPTDVTGLSIYNQKTREFEFQPGPIFANVVLVDEINRAMPKTQAALLEAMAEHQVTSDGHTSAAAALPAPGDGEPDRVRGHLPAPRGAARPVLPARRRSATRRSTTSSRSSTTSVSTTPSPTSARSSRSRTSASSPPPSATSTSTRCSRAGSSSSFARPATHPRSRSVPPSAEASRSSAPRGPGRCSTTVRT